jgi:transcriptional regulator with XRE-family HTH domain
MATKRTGADSQQPRFANQAQHEPDLIVEAPRKNGGRTKNSAGEDAAKANESGPPMDVIAIQLKASREARGVSISQLHTTTGIARTALHDYEAGRYKPGANEIRKLCEALGITPNKLLTGRDNPATPETPLEKVFGAGSENVKVAKAGQLLLMLPLEERDAFYKLLLGLVSARYPAEQVAKVLEGVDMLMGVMNFAAARVTNPDEEISEETARKRIAEIAPDLVSDERAERVRKQREKERQVSSPASKPDEK